MKAFSLVTTATLVALMVGGTVTNAATYPSATQATTDGTIKFTKNLTPPEQIPDPEKPGETVKPEKPGNQNDGDLMITYVSDLNFGTHKEGESWEWFAKADKMTGDKYVTPFVSVKDNQGPNRNGWTLTATLDKNFISTDGNELRGAKLLYSNMSSKAPEGAQSPKTAPTVASGEKELTKGVAVQIASADATNGLGLHSIALGNLDKRAEDGVTNGVKLTTTNKTQPLDKEYQTSITYELIAEPKTATLEVKNSEIFVGEDWKAECNFVSATDTDGNAVAFSDIDVEGSVNTSKPGAYPVVYKNDTIEKTATIKVKENKASLEVKDSKIFVGEEWKAEDNFISATAKDGNAVALKDIVVDGSVDTSKPDEYKVVFKNDTIEKTATVTVSENPDAPKENEDGSIEFVGHQWDVINTYEDGSKMIAMQEGISKSSFNESYTYFSTDANTLDGYQDSVVKPILDGWYNENIKGTAEEGFVRPVSLLNPTLQDMKGLGWTSNESGLMVIDEWNANVNDPSKYPTKVGKGEKQAFLMSGSDVTNDASGDLKPEALVHQANLKKDGIAYSWLRSPGSHVNYAAILDTAESDMMMKYVRSLNDVVPTLVVHMTPPSEEN